MDLGQAVGDTGGGLDGYEDGGLDGLGLLGLTGCLTRLLLIRAYRLQMKRVHPDFHPHADGAQRAELVQSAQEINAAYEALSAALESAN